MSNLTVLIPTHPIPDHPSTKHLDETIFNIRKYTDAEIIIMFDGIHPSLENRRQQYQDYKEAVNHKIREYGFCNVASFDEHQHQTGMTRRVLEFVKTPLIMFCEHDTSPIGSIPFGQLCELVERSPDINYLRFNIFEKTPDEHQYLMLDKEPIISAFDGFDTRSGEVKTAVRLIRTIQWSQRPHIAKADWYRLILAKWFNEKEKMMIEDRMHSVVQQQFEMIGFDTFGLAIYAPEGNQLRSFHSDARGSDHKIIGDE